MTDFCPCSSSLYYSDCCEPFILGERLPETAEKLMRSRYSSYAKFKIDYLVNTTHSSTRSKFSRREIEDWSRSNQWVKLEILYSTENSVEFKAYFTHEGPLIQVHHEKSRFTQEDGKWYYVDGVFYG